MAAPSRQPLASDPPQLPEHAPQSPAIAAAPFQAIHRVGRTQEWWECSVPGCGKVFLTADRCCQHLFSEHATGRSVATRSRLGSNEAGPRYTCDWNLPDKALRYSCPRCDYGNAAQSGTIDHHMRVCHVKEAGTVECPYCTDFWTGRQQAYTRHVNNFCPKRPGRDQQNRSQSSNPDHKKIESSSGSSDLTRSEESNNKRRSVFEPTERERHAKRVEVRAFPSIRFQQHHGTDIPHGALSATVATTSARVAQSSPPNPNSLPSHDSQQFVFDPDDYFDDDLIDRSRNYPMDW